MEHIEYAYTTGMDESDVDQRLQETETGVLALADESNAYAIPLAHYYEGDRNALYFRLGEVEGSQKRAFIDTTETACYVLYDAEPTEAPRELDSWSILITGTLHELTADEQQEFDTAAINRRFAPIRVFDEDIPEIDITIIRLDIDTMSGRFTPA